MEDKRKYLINLARGGDGHISPWIERVTIRRPGQLDAAAFVFHYQAIGADGQDMQVQVNNLEAAQSLMLIVEDGGQPRDPGVSLEEIRSRNAARIAAMPPPEDRGRVIEEN